MDFGEAIKKVKAGYKIQREGWNGKEQYVELASSISYVNAQGKIVNVEHAAIGTKALAFVGICWQKIGSALNNVCARCSK